MIRNNRFFIVEDVPYYWGWVSPAVYNGSVSYGSVMVAVQERLARNGYYRGPIDGIIGSVTREAIAGYERDHHLLVAARIDEPLLRSLGLA